MAALQHQGGQNCWLKFWKVSNLSREKNDINFCTGYTKTERYCWTQRFCNNVGRLSFDSVLTENSKVAVPLLCYNS